MQQVIVAPLEISSSALFREGGPRNEGFVFQDMTSKIIPSLRSPDTHLQPQDTFNNRLNFIGSFSFFIESHRVFFIFYRRASFPLTPQKSQG